MRQLKRTLTAAVTLAALAACQDAPGRLTGPDEVALARHSLPTWEVTTLDDVDDGACTRNRCSLREALAAAVASGEPESRITFKRKLSGTIVLGGELLISGPVSTTISIEGPGADRLHLSGNDAGRVLALWSAGTILHVSGLTLRDGNGVSGFGAGAILNRGTMVLSEVVVRDNVAQVGGAIDNGGRLRIERSTLSGNRALWGGGAIMTSGRLALDRVTISGNESGDAGGAIYVGTGAELDLGSSTLTRNRAAASGGGLFIQGATGSSRVVNSIIAGNSAAGSDDAPTADCSLGGFVGGFGHNLVGEQTGCDVLAIATGVVLAPAAVFTDVLEAALTANGGPTPTHALIDDGINPAVDAGYCPGDETVDQRGVPRPVELAEYPNAPLSNGCDIGAFELQAPGGGKGNPRGPGGPGGPGGPPSPQ